MNNQLRREARFPQMRYHDVGFQLGEHLVYLNEVLKSAFSKKREKNDEGMLRFM